MHPLEFLYYLGFSARQYYSIRNRKRLPCRVISIGNITVGGTGKTPAAIAVAEEAQKRCLSPIILTRGYKGTAKGPCFVTKGEGPLLSVKEAGDEPYLMAGRLNRVPIVKGSDRYEAGMFALRELDIREPELKTHIFVLDDGFQHLGLYRDKDVILIDAGNPFGNRVLLPVGRLREPLKSLERADIIVLTKADEGDRNTRERMNDLSREIKRYAPRSDLFYATHGPLSCVLTTGEEMPVSWISGKRLFGFCGLGSPDSFRRTLVATGGELRGFLSFRDHYSYTPNDIARIRDEAERCGAVWIVTTEKDIIKARNHDLPDNIVTLKVSFAVEKGFFERVFSL